MRRAIRRKFVDICNRVQSPPLPPATKEEEDRIQDIRSRFEKLAIIESPAGTPDSEAEWNANMNCVRDLMLSGNPREFLRWDVIRYTMFSCDDPYLSTELKYLKAHRLWNSLWKELLVEDRIGNPIPYFRYPGSSGNLIHHAYHVARFQDETTMDVSDMDFVLEFGGGYGSFCRVLHKVGFHGKYVIFDLPHFSELQRYFLQSIGVPVINSEDFKTAEAGVCCISSFEQLESIIASLPKDSTKLFSATWSLSETPIHIRDRFLPHVKGFDSALVAYQHQFNEMDNLAFFKNWRNSEMKELDWIDAQISQIPDSSYLFGWRAK